MAASAPPPSGVPATFKVLCITDEHQGRLQEQRMIWSDLPLISSTAEIQPADSAGGPSMSLAEPPSADGTMLSEAHALQPLQAPKDMYLKCACGLP